MEAPGSSELSRGMVELWSAIRPDGDNWASDREGHGLALCTLFSVSAVQKAGSELVAVRLLGDIGRRRAQSGSMSRSDRSVALVGAQWRAAASVLFALFRAHIHGEPLQRLRHRVCPRMIANSISTPAAIPHSCEPASAAEHLPDPASPFPYESRRQLEIDASYVTDGRVKQHADVSGCWGVLTRQ